MSDEIKLIIAIAELYGISIEVKKSDGENQFTASRFADLVFYESEKVDTGGIKL